MCLRAPKITYVNISFFPPSPPVSYFPFPSCFLSIFHHYIHTDHIPPQTRGDFRASEEIKSLKKPNEQHWTWCRTDISAGILISSPSDNVVLT